MPSTEERLGFSPDCLSTAMAIMPHRDAAEALDAAFRFDIPFWPQLPSITFWEDSYVQTARGFPGIVVDDVENRLTWDEELFLAELESYLAYGEGDDFFGIAPGDSLTYGLFRNTPLADRISIRGQLMGPISFCLKVLDAEKKPIIYRDDIRELAVLHIARKVNRQLRDLRRLHPHAFVWVDEPGLEILFSGITGYASDRAREDMASFLAMLDGPRAVHLCGNPDWDFLLRADLDLLSFNAFGCGTVFAGYAESVRTFLERGSAICWGIVPTNAPDLAGWEAAALVAELRGIWHILESHGVAPDMLHSQALISPATCCLINSDLTASVDTAFWLTHEVSRLLRS